MEHFHYYLCRQPKAAEWRLLCLKGWSSYTPELSLGLDENDIKCGGGFFIHYDGIGIVVDPGLNFIENLHKHNLFIQDIDYVIVTHNHIDHNNDLGKIIDMSLQMDVDIKFLLDEKTYEKYRDELRDIRKKNNKNVKEIFIEKSEMKLYIKSHQHRVRMCVYPTEHNCQGSFGMKLFFEHKILGYTSDTKYNKNIGTFFKNCDVLIANISETNYEDLTLNIQKENHLGIKGVFSLLSEMVKEKCICLLTEFWGGLGDIRIETAQMIKNYLEGKDVEIIPMDIGVIFFVKENQFLCNACGNVVNNESKKIVKYKDKLKCLCNECMY